MIWVDIETTGLDYERDHILEIGFVITNPYLDPIDTFAVQIWDEHLKLHYEDMLTSDYVYQMHEKSGLWEACQKDGRDEIEAGIKMHNWLTKHNVRDDEPLCGSSVQFDRTFLTRDYGSTMKYFSYRNVDISTIKELCRRFNPEVFANMEAKKRETSEHRVAPDLVDTIEEFRFYRDNFLFTTVG